MLSQILDLGLHRRAGMGPRYVRVRHRGQGGHRQVRHGKQAEDDAADGGARAHSVEKLTGACGGSKGLVRPTIVRR
jgi:hypothetical protein